MSQRRVQLLPQALLSLPVFLFSFLWAVIAHFTDISNNKIDHVLLRLFLLIIVQFVFFAFPFLAWRWVCPRVQQRSWTKLLIASIIVGAAVRGWVFGLLLFQTGLTATPEYAFRILSSIANMATVTVLLWFVVSEVRTLQARRRLLLAERDQLIRLQESAQVNLDELGDRAAGEIRTLVLASLGSSDAASASELLKRLRRTIDEVVRPLSHRLSMQGAAWKPPELSAQETRVNWWLAVKDGLDPVRIHPLVVTLALIWLGLPVHVVQYGPKYALFLIGTGVIGFPVFWLMRNLAIRVSAGRRAGIRILAFVLAVLIGGESMGLTSLLYMQGQRQPYLFVIMVPIFALLVSAPIAVAQAARDQSLAIETELEVTTANLRWTLARTREQHRQQERALAHALHGRIQASLASAIVRLDRAVAQGADEPELVAALQREVHDALAALDLRSSEPESLEQVIALTQRNWEGAAEVTKDVSPVALTAIEGDVLCAVAVNDVIPELAFNSFRHGKATLIEITLNLVDDRTLALTVIDNGDLEERETRQGMGTQLLDAACIQWSRERIDGKTHTTCLLPCLPLNSK